MKIDYEELCKRSVEENWDIKYETFRVWTESESPALRMAHKPYPVGLKEMEAQFIHDFILEHGLRWGFEVATGFGASALAAGLAFKETGGKLVTMDAYIEEDRGDPNVYRGAADETTFTNKNADGYVSAKNLAERYGLLWVTLVPVVGSSPGDVDSVIRDFFEIPMLDGASLDYVFIDAGHWDEAVRRDLDAVFPFLAKRRAVFFHDVHCFSGDTIAYIEGKLGGKLVTAVKPPNGWNLSYVSNLP